MEGPDLNSFLKTMNIDEKRQEKKRKRKRRGGGIEVIDIKLC